MTPDILTLQYFQEMHDRQYHADIYTLPLMRRLAHLHNHLTKYCVNKVVRADTYPKALACLLSMANALNVNVEVKMSKWSGEIVSGVEKIPLMYRADRLKQQMVECLGNMAKVLEGSDHMESIQYREKMQDLLIELFIVWAGMRVEVDEHNIQDWTFEYVYSICQVKKKSIFYAYNHASDMTNQKYRGVIWWLDAMQAQNV